MGIPALETTVDNVGDESITGRAVGSHVIRGRNVGANHDVVARGLGGPRGHPEPNGGLEGVVGDDLRGAEAVEAKGPAGGAVVVVLGELDGAAALVGLAGEAGPLGVRGVAVVALWANLLLETEAPSVGTIRGGGPTTGGLVGDLGEKGGDLALAGGRIPDGGESGEASGGGDEGVVGVEVVGRAGGVVLMEEDGVEELLGDQSGDCWGCGSGSPCSAKAEAAQNSDINTHTHTYF